MALKELCHSQSRRFFPKTRNFAPFLGILPPFCKPIGFESGRGQPLSGTQESGRATHSLAREKPGWPPTFTWPLSPAQRSTPPAPLPTSGVRSCANPPPLDTARHRQPNWQRSNGADLEERPFYNSVCHRTRRLPRKNQSVSPHSLPPPNR